MANEFDLEQSFLKSLEEASEIATKTKLNIDDMPAFVTVLHRERMLKLGVDNIFEALAFVPGVHLSREGTGVPVVVFRGATQKGEAKLMVDGVTINNAYRGSIYYYLDFPIELVERIEVIRGPGSVLYGSNAISGVINLITKSAARGSSSVVFGAGGSEESYKGGTVVRVEEGESSIALDAYYQRTDRKIAAGPDAGGSYGESDHSFRDYAVGIFLTDGGFSFNGRIKRNRLGTGYGLGNYFEETNDKKGNLNESAFAEIGYQHHFSSDLSLKTLAGYSQYSQEIEARFIPDLIGSNDLIASNDYQEHSYYVESIFKSRQFDQHEFVAGVRYEEAKSDRTAFDNYVETVMVSPIAGTDIIQPDRRREMISLYMNDRFSMSDRLDISAGVRWDHYNEFGNAYSPRIGVVYAATDELNIKAMASRAFRAPSWIELYGRAVSIGDDTLQEERADTIEIGAVYKPGTMGTLRVNAFMTRINNMIVKNGSQYLQHGDNDFMGVELEYDQAVNKDLRINLIASYLYGEDQDGQKLPDIANYMASANIIYDFGKGFTSGTTARYVSGSKRAVGDPRDELDAYVTLNQTLTYRYKELSINATVKNLFDRDVVYASPAGTYPNDYPEIGRLYCVKAAWEF